GTDRRRSSGRSICSAGWRAPTRRGRAPPAAQTGRRSRNGTRPAFSAPRSVIVGDISADRRCGVESPNEPFSEKSMREKKSKKQRWDLAFEAEARRQSFIINAAAQDPNSNEAAVTRELEAHWIQ